MSGQLSTTNSASRLRSAIRGTRVSAFAHGAWRCDGVDLVVRGDQLTADEEAVVLGVEDSGLVVLAREGLDGVERFPEREHHELLAFGDCAPEHPDALVAGDLRVAGDAGVLHVGGVGVAVMRSD